MSFWAYLLLILALAITAVAVVGLTLLRDRWGEPLLVTWPSALLVVAGFVVILLTAQGHELALGLTDAPFYWHAVFVLTIAYWAFQLWFWGRQWCAWHYSCYCWNG